MRNNITRAIWGLVCVVVVIDMVVNLKRRAALSVCDMDRLNITRKLTPTADNPAKAPADYSAKIAASQMPVVNEQLVEFCRPDVPCVYPDDVDFRIIVMTYKRTESLLKLLRSMDNIVLNGAKAAVEIFIDRNSKGEVHQATVDAALNHTWPLGRKRVHVWSKHVGIYGQWIDSWRPKPGSDEITLILEDDISVSKYCYLWLKAAHATYDSRTDISGYTLQSSNLKSAKGQRPFLGPKEDSAFLYRVLGSWGFSPHPKVWRDFQDWFHEAHTNKSFHPYVEGIAMNAWYKSFERKGSANTMWTMWFIWYTDKYNTFCLIHNLQKFVGSKKTALAVNRQEPGLHYGGKGIDNTGNLLTEWSEKYIQFPEKTKKYDYDAKVIN